MIEMDGSLIGKDKREIPTPALLLDLDGVEHNLTEMADFFEDREADLRPHIKTHKSPFLAHKQLEAGAIGITCQKLSEAEVMARSGIKDILIANEVVGEVKTTRLARLARSVDLKVAVDDEANARALDRACREAGSELGVLVELNVGLNRCGIPPGERALPLARFLRKTDNLVFRGLMGYEGHTVFIDSFEERKRRAEEALKAVVGTKELLEEEGIGCPVVSSGATGTHEITGSYPGVTEVEAGSYLTMDGTYAELDGVGEKFQTPLTLLATVISRPAEDRAVLDSGMKSITHDMGDPQFVGLEGATVTSFSEEHLNVRIEGPEVEAFEVLRPGEKVELLPSHGCTTINLHDQFYGIRDGDLEAILPVEARGKFV